MNYMVSVYNKIDSNGVMNNVWRINCDGKTLLMGNRDSTTNNTKIEVLRTIEESIKRIKGSLTANDRVTLEVPNIKVYEWLKNGYKGSNGVYKKEVERVEKVLYFIQAYNIAYNKNPKAKFVVGKSQNNLEGDILPIGDAMSSWGE